MSKRVYNILFHLHTVSGITISVVLFVIFFTGSFSFFRDEIVNWERNHTVPNSEEIEISFDAMIDSLKNDYNLQGRDIAIAKHHIEQKIGVKLDASKDSLAKPEDKTSKFFYLDTKTFESADYKASYSLGEFLYRLHFLAQVPYPAGYYLSGFVAFFFIFAIITGILVHWGKIVSNFYVFRPWAKLKTMWTDAHTALGTIGLPFQFVYAVTGAFFMIKALLVFPSVFVLYEGDEQKLYNDLGYTEPSFEYRSETLATAASIDKYVEKTKSDWNDFNINHVHVFNYGDKNMHISIEGETDPKAKFTGPGKRIYNISTGQLVEEKSPFVKSSYLDAVKNLLYRLHFGDYGGYALKIISFILGIISCFVIISGVMIWLVARDKKNLSHKKRKFNEKVVLIYLAICLSMYPVTALTFIVVKIFSPASQSFIYQFYFLSWLVLTVVYIVKRNNYFITKNSLLMGSSIGFLIPWINGLMTGNWIWVSYSQNYSQIFIVDLLWIITSILTFFAYLKSKPPTDLPSTVTSDFILETREKLEV